MRIMGLDLGTKTIGVAVSDESRITAQPIGVIRRVSFEKDLIALKELVEKYQVTEIVLGLPVNMNGTMGDKSISAMRFRDKIAERTGLPVGVWDERLSTAAVNRVLIDGDMSRAKRKGVVDKLAASYILQGYLDSIKFGANRP
ncbi:MAG: Holliday junction resolvase RuvX [Deltaproteobacteria bacterium]|mgnify:CR=1 FL=1